MKPILTDIDGVVFEWETAFYKFMERKGHTVVTPDVYNISEMFDINKDKGKELTREFNESGTIGYLKPLRDAKKYVKSLIEKGFEFQGITSLSTNEFAGRLRRYNLDNEFGSDFNCTCLDTGADKDNELKKYSPGHWWIEDKPANCEAGLSAGHKVILVDHLYNRSYNNKDVIRVQSWKEIHDIITGENDGNIT
jgi:hypothetical protein